MHSREVYWWIDTPQNREILCATTSSSSFFCVQKFLFLISFGALGAVDSEHTNRMDGASVSRDNVININRYRDVSMERWKWVGSETGCTRVLYLFGDINIELAPKVLLRNFNSDTVSSVLFRFWSLLYVIVDLCDFLLFLFFFSSTTSSIPSTQNTPTQTDSPRIRCPFDAFFIFSTSPIPANSFP